MTKIVQCVPNISEGIDLDKIERIVAPLKDRPGFKLVSYEPDKDYNRTVITLLGDPSSMIEPLIEFYGVAQKEIDMNTHKGAHPRMGAVDVCPFIPISNIKMDECVQFAEELGEKVSEKLNIPVFLYAEAAKKKDRVLLPNIRKGEYEGMKYKIKEEQWHPDFGKPEINTFGAAAIGARMPLIAYNIDLDTNEERHARLIARRIRGSSGGYKYVQAGPALLEERGHMQVTMNILDYEKNDVYRIFETVRMEAKRYQVEILSSEVVGLIPKQTLLRSIRYYLEVDGLEYNKDMSLDELTRLSIKYLKLRDFDKAKIIEANI